MKLHLMQFAAAAALMFCAAQAQSADPAHYGTFGTSGIAPGDKPPVKASNGEVWRIRVLALRREALDLQQRDGGTLTPEHRAMLQAKLDRINAQAQQP